MKVGSVRIVNPAKRISTVAFPIKNIDPVFSCTGDDVVLVEEEEEEEEEDAVESIISFVVLNTMVSQLSSIIIDIINCRRIL
jgi:hypothetical protein